MSSNDIERARRQELAAEAAIGGLGRDEWLELRRQVGMPPVAAEQEAMERAAAAIELARQPRLEPMPRHLLGSITAAAERHFAPRRATPAAVPRRREVRPRGVAYRRWVAAAASLVAVIGLALLERRDVAREPDAARSVDPARARPAGFPDGDAPTGPDDAAAPSGRFGDAAESRLLAAPVAPEDDGQAGGPGAGDDESSAMPDAAAARGQLAAQRFVLRRNWAPAGDPVGREVQGDVVWDARTQTGYMRFTGLRRNDPATEQYQLWIFDGRRDERYPVDGGVFDVRGDGAELVVPIRARLPVGTPLAFAVTIERPGGVVVSDRSRVVVIARVG
jgi:hypothetical protein